MTMKTFFDTGIRATRFVAILMVLFLSGASVFPADSTPKRLLIVGQGTDGHPATTHEFMAGTRVLAELLKPYKEIQATVVKADEPWTGGPKLIDEADGIVMLVTQGA